MPHNQFVSDTNILPQRKIRNGKEMFQVSLPQSLATRIRVAAAQMGVRPNRLAEVAFTAFLDAQASQAATPKTAA